MKPQIVMPVIEGKNFDLDRVNKRLEKAQTYSDLSTVIICPSRGMVHCKVVLSWMGMMRPMNQKVAGPIFGTGMEVGEAYNQLIEMILQHPDLSKWKYLLTVEEDNIPPADGLLKLYEAIEGKVDGKKYDVVGGLYFTKGELGQPMIYGDPAVMPKNFIPQKPIQDTVQQCNGLGMGFNLFRMSIFKKIEKPWFKTFQELVPGKGVMAMSQDLYFYDKAAQCGFKFASDNRCKVGHYDAETDTTW